MRLAWLMT